MRNFIKLVSLSAALISTMSYAGDRIDKSLAVNDASKVIIENQRGMVSIIGTNNSTVSVVGELDDKTEAFIFEHSGATIMVKVKVPNNQRSWRNDGEGSNLTIKIPQQLRVDFNGISSNVSVEKLAQGVDIKTVSGEITVSKLQNNIEINSVSGDIDSTELSGKIQLSTVSGDIEDVKSAGRLSIKSVSGSIQTETIATEVVAETVSGDIELALADIDELEISTVSGDSDVDFALNENGSVKLSSVSGEFDLNFSKDIQANFRLQTNAGGSIKNKLTSDKAKRGKYVPSEKLSFTMGSGSGSVKASTVSGDIQLSKK
ncbi:MAG: DUF4097 family beta strand repeat-containing protein [Thalassotalea sp.]